MSQRPSLFIHLPTELVTYILQLAAAGSHHCSLAICLVASWTRRITLPHLFHTIVIEGIIAYTKFQEYIIDPPSPYVPTNTNFAGPFVNGVWLELGQFNRIVLPTVFEACENITHWALQGADLRSLISSSV
jgi:hypothetical protein